MVDHRYRFDKDGRDEVGGTQISYQDVVSLAEQFLFFLDANPDQVRCDEALLKYKIKATHFASI